MIFKFRMLLRAQTVLRRHCDRERKRSGKQSQTGIAQPVASRDAAKQSQKALLAMTGVWFLVMTASAFSQPTPAQIERSQELLDKEKALREELERGEKVFVKKIIVKGVTLFKPEKIEAIISPLEGHWLTKEDIRQIRALIEQAYLESGYLNEIKGVSSLVKKQILEIQVEEAGR